MALTIRLTKMGKKGERKYRVAVKEIRSRRDGKAVEFIGFHEKGKNGKTEINKERYQYWLSIGAKPSEAVEKIITK